MMPHIHTDEEILEAARTLFAQKGWFTTRDIYWELMQDKCPRNDDRPLSLHRINMILRYSGARTISKHSAGYTRYVFPEER